jgi:hypothetical protein
MIAGVGDQLCWIVGWVVILADLKNIADRHKQRTLIGQI